MFFFNDTATTEIYTLSLHDALPILERVHAERPGAFSAQARGREDLARVRDLVRVEGAPQQLHDVHVVCGEHLRSEEHTSELQSRQYLVCRLLLEKKKKITVIPIFRT